ncbi:c-type cytochrome [Alicyclobacillus mengziensis]|uniref:Cytochrome c n=1 Tax=Alicyclobacillus mengziensis TaxID=2931921 RepID=A0A9X7VXM7_9BACL|nr:cytochrome c [Alicyclobacillus mengziensis]QSO46455.1 cytochrome c [Alicyclobacillus mengziensis]
MQYRRKVKLYAGGIGLIIAIAGFVVGCGTSGGANATNNASGNGNTSQPAATLTGDATQGVRLFQQSCSMCHSTGTNTVVGPGLQGIMNKSKLPNGKPVTDENVMNWIRTGGGGMPGFPQLTNQQRADIVAYLKTLS